MPREQRRRPVESNSNPLTEVVESATSSYAAGLSSMNLATWVGESRNARSSAPRAQQATTSAPQRQMTEREQIGELVNLQIEMEAEEREQIRIARQSREQEVAPSYNEPPRRRDMGYLNLERVLIERWGRGELSGMFDRYDREVAHRLNWIFNRIEREGFTRRMRTGDGAERLPPFSLDDLHRKLQLQKPHPLNTEEKKFYDWKLNNSEFMLRLEYFTKQFEQDRDADFEHERTRHYLRVWILHKPSGRMIGYNDRLWDGSKFKERQAYWAEE